MSALRETKWGEKSGFQLTVRIWGRHPDALWGRAHWARGGDGEALTPHPFEIFPNLSYFFIVELKRRYGFFHSHLLAFQVNRTVHL